MVAVCDWEAASAHCCCFSELGEESVHACLLPFLSYWVFRLFSSEYHRAKSELSNYTTRELCSGSHSVCTQAVPQELEEQEWNYPGEDGLCLDAVMQSVPLSSAAWVPKKGNSEASLCYYCVCARVCVCVCMWVSAGVSYWLYSDALPINPPASTRFLPPATLFSTIHHKLNTNKVICDYVTKDFMFCDYSHIATFYKLEHSLKC